MTMTQLHKQEETELPTRTGKGSIPRHWWFWLLMVILAAFGAYKWAMRDAGVRERSVAKGTAAQSPATSVLAIPARMGDMGVYLAGLGSVTPLNVVTVKSRVDGQLMGVRFGEGELVQKGRLLAEIDPRPFQVQLKQAEGQLDRDRALLLNARLDLQRYQTLDTQDSIAKQQYDTQKSLVQQLEGTVKVDQGLIDNARLQLSYCRITAPLSGRVGLRQVDPGNIIHATDTNGLVVITQLQPIAVIFPVPEDSLPQVLGRLDSGVRLPVEAFDREMKEKLATGNLLTVDNQIDPNTGTVKFKAVFANKRKELFPNQFVNARLLVDVLRNTVIVPSAAIQRGPEGTFAYIVKGDRTVAMRPVTVGITEGGETSVAAGLSAGELVVVEGAEKLREGSKVELRGRSGASGNRQRR